MKKTLCLVTCFLLMAGFVSAEKTKVRWFVGLGGGTDASSLKPQQDVVDRFNASQDKFELVLEIVAMGQAPDALSTEIQAGNPPDIVGPVGINGRNNFRGLWADLGPLIKKYNYNLKDFDPAIVELLRVENQRLGLPFAIYPSVVFFNKDLFDEAHIPYPPQKYGRDYIDRNGRKRPWNTDTLREIAMLLTVDRNGRDATAKDFDPEQVVQFGYGEQMTDLRGVATLFGAGSLLDPNGNAQIPPNWRHGLKWHYDAMWKDRFVPTNAYASSDAFGNGNWFQTGNMAMVHIHLWYLGFANLKFNWDVACVPAYKGTTTAKLHVDTFEIVKSSKNKDAAFQVLTYLVGDGAPELLNIYGASPARLSLQSSYYKRFNEVKFPGKKITWQVFVDGMRFADNPNHETWVPNFPEAITKYQQYFTKFGDEPNLNIDKELDSLTADLQKIFQAAKK